MAQQRRHDIAIFVPAVGAQLIATTGIFLVPFIIGALLDSKFLICKLQD